MRKKIELNLLLVIISNKFIMESHHYHSKITEEYGDCQYIRGHFSNGQERNPIWIVNKDGKELYLMYCEPGKVTTLCRESYQKLLDFEKDNNENKKISFSVKSGTNYIRSSTSLYLHQAIMNWYGHGSGTANLSVDHIDRNPLNNTLANLRIATCEEQHANTKGHLPNTKKERQHQARELPEGIAHQDMPKYVNYNINRYGKNNEFSREFFRIENHPTLNGKIWSSTTKRDVSIHEKLRETKLALEQLNNGIIPERKQRELPSHVTAYVERGRATIAWQKNENTKRLNRKINLSQEYHTYDEQKQEEILSNLNKEVIRKYGTKYCIFEISEEDNQKIEKEKDEALPKHVRTQVFGEELYLMYNKDDHSEGRLCASTKLPNNYNINKELALFNQKIVEKYGNEHAIDLERFPYVLGNVTTFQLPTNVYISLKCKSPYLLLVKDTETFSMSLPERYDLATEVEKFLLPENQIKDTTFSIEQHKESFYQNGRKPENISICLKENKYHQLQYKVKTKELRHDKAKSLPSTEFNMELELFKFNKCIVEKFGDEFAFLQQNVTM
jgi:hypothetical protein